ncbi:uncharacterized protein LOC123299007 [Chrysoperla carnea]|uniref:uncharacterized protein LOC123299007 n=1 Tax=Chrysoperla carnea TaxID=189513 RepID=UPI001D068DD0|nr:uncharacterized protein LOC123299007 [Chrysoperla carnea]
MSTNNLGVFSEEINEQLTTTSTEPTQIVQNGNFTLGKTHLINNRSSIIRPILSDSTSDTSTTAAAHLHNISDDDEITRLRNSQFIWTSPMVYALIEEYRKLIVQFRDPKARQKDLWIKVADGMQMKGYHVDYQMCDRKWRNLKQTFKSIYYDKRKKRQRTWEFYEILQIIFTPDPRGRILRKSRMVLPIPSDDEMEEDPLNSATRLPQPKKKRLRPDDVPYADNLPLYIEESYPKPIDTIHDTSFSWYDTSQDTSEKDDEDSENVEEIKAEEFIFEETEVEYKEVEGPAWFRTAMENLRADQRARVLEARRMHRELLEAEKRKCDLLEALLKVLQPPQG